MERHRISFSNSGLKLIAVITMLIDHTGLVILRYWPSALEPVSLFGFSTTLYQISRAIGRIAFPIFCFLLVEGFWHTSSRFRYARNLFLFALISEIPFNYMFSTDGRWENQNVYFTLLLGFLVFCALERFQNQLLLQILSVTAGFAASMILKADYDYRGFVLLMILYFFAFRPAERTLLACISLYWEWPACFAFLPIHFYNGERGFIKGKAAKYFFYGFYPVHMILLVCLRHLLFGL